MSLAATGAPCENTKAGSFFKTLKCQQMYSAKYRTSEEVKAQLRRFIFDVYKAKRLYSSPRYRSSMKFEGAHLCGALLEAPT